MSGGTPTAAPALRRRWVLRRPASGFGGALLIGGCLAVAAWIVLVSLAGLFVTAFNEDTGYGPGAWTLDNFSEAYRGAHIFALLANSVV